MPLHISGKGFSANPSRSARTASKPRFMLRPWSPSPIARSRAVSSSALSITAEATAAMRRLLLSLSNFIVALGSRARESAELAMDSIPFAVEIKRPVEADVDAVADRKSGIRIDKRNDLAVGNPDMKVVVVAQMLDPGHLADRASVDRLGNPQVLRAGADDGRGRRDGDVGEKARRHQVDRRLAETRRDVEIGRVFIDLSRAAYLDQAPLLDH